MSWRMPIAAVMVCLMLAVAGCERTAAADKKGPGQDVFGLTRTHRLHLQLSTTEWEQMQPAAPRFPGMPGQRGGPGAARPKTTDVHRGGFGMEFPWARGELTFDGQTLKDVGLRYKGNYTYMASARRLKRPLKVALGHYQSGQRLHGLKTFNLHNGVTDETRTREVLSYAVFRAAGVPAPRTAFAEVTLTVPGKYDKEYVGLYTLTEQVDKAFLADRFGRGDGLLLKPEGLQGGLPYLGESWKQYEQRYRPQGRTDGKQQKRLIEFSRLVNQAEDARFRDEIGSYLDVEAFLRFLAVNALLANLDSFLGFGHNYYLYLRPDTDRFVFVPWDVDLSLGTWPAGGTPEQQLDLSVFHPHRGRNRLLDRLLALPDVAARYRKVLEELTAGCFSREHLLADLEAVEKVVREPLAQETAAARARKEGRGGGFGFGPADGVYGRSLPPRKFFEKRPEMVAAQLAGKSKGYIPPEGFGFGPPRGFGGPPGQQGEVMSRQMQDQLGLSAEQREKIAQLQKEVERRLEEILSAEQNEQRRKLRGRPGGPPGFPGRRGRP